MYLTEKDFQSIFVDGEFLTQEQFQHLVEESKALSVPFDEYIIAKGLLSDEHVGELMAYFRSLPFVNLRLHVIPDQTLRILPAAMAQKHRAVVFFEDAEHLSVAMNDPENLELIHLLQKKTGKEVVVSYATKQDIQQTLRLYSEGIEKELQRLAEQTASKNVEEDSSIVTIVDTILRYAYESHASDVHIEPTETRVLIRFRIDGILHDVGTVPLAFHDHLVMRIKVLSNLRTDEHRIAQDGKLVFTVPDEEVDVRVSIVPITNGEKIVLRILAENTQSFSLDSLGLNEKQLQIVRQAIQKSHGMILATGPTGSGKSTTLYALLKILNSRRVNISTIEDPVEYHIEGVNQIQVDPKTNLTFASGLRAIVRQDPDVIMVGEIRDEETAGIAINSSMTGHLVLSTLHTNDAATTLPRLIDMDIEPFLIASTVNVIIAQRLVRRICSQCVQSVLIRGELLTEVQQTFQLSQYLAFPQDHPPEEVRFYQGKGCHVCHQTGYVGRIGVFEVMEMSASLQECVMKKMDAAQIREQARKEGMMTMYEDGLQKALQGVTTIEEVMRVIKE